MKYSFYEQNLAVLALDTEVTKPWVVNSVDLRLKTPDVQIQKQCGILLIWLIHDEKLRGIFEIGRLTTRKHRIKFQLIKLFIQRHIQNNTHNNIKITQRELHVVATQETRTYSKNICNMYLIEFIQTYIIIRLYTCYI